MKRICLLALLVALLAFPAFAELQMLTNGSFENITGIYADGWDMWAWGGGWSGFIDESATDFSAYDGTAYAYAGGWLGNSGGVTYTINPTVGHKYAVSVWTATENWGDDHNLNINVKWWGDFGGGVTEIMETFPVIVNGPQDLVWRQHSVTTGACPAGTTSGQFELESFGTGTVMYDLASMVAIGVATDPDPLDNSASLETTSVTDIAWVLPSPINGIDTITCDVWIREYNDPTVLNDPNYRNDPNFITAGAVKLVNKQSVTSVNLATAGYTIIEDRTYLWKVDCYDPNGVNPEVFTPGAVWGFDTINTAPVVDAGLKQAKWLPNGGGSVVFDLDAIVTDDGLPASSTLAIQWQPVAGVSFDDDSLENAQATISVAGDYLLTLDADDGQKTDSDTVLLRVHDYATTGLLAEWPLDGDAVNVLGDSAKDGIDVGVPNWVSDSQVGTGSLESSLNNYIEIPNSGSDPLSEPATWADLTDEVTLSAWIKIDGFEVQWQGIISKGNGTYRLQRADLTDSLVFGYGEGAEQWLAWGSQNVADNQWHHIAGTADGTYVRLYIDGVMDAEALADTAVNPIPIQPGNLQFTSGGGSSTKIDNVRLRNIGIPYKSDHTGTPSVFAEFISDGGQNACGQVYSDADVNKDCYIDLTDFALMAAEWLNCTDITNTVALGGTCTE